MSTAAPRPPTKANDEPARPRRGFAQQFAWWVRWLHIYLSMFSFAALLFFAVTGLTLNHPTWLGGSSASSRSAEGQLPAGLVPTSGEGEAGIQKLELVEHLRREHAIGGALIELRADDVECSLAFKGPGYAADVTIDRATSHYELSESRFAAVAILNDLHKGRDSGRAWSWVIDVSAILMGIVSLTGLVLLFYLKRRLMTGLATLAAGAAVLVGIYLWLVP